MGAVKEEPGAAQRVKMAQGSLQSLMPHHCPSAPSYPWEKLPRLASIYHGVRKDGWTVTLQQLLHGCNVHRLCVPGTNHARDLLGEGARSEAGLRLSAEQRALPFSVPRRRVSGARYTPGTPTPVAESHAWEGEPATTGYE